MYQSNVYPFYDNGIQLITTRLHIDWRLPPSLRDTVTILALAFIAARSESLIRDKRSLFLNVVRGLRAALSKNFFPVEEEQEGDAGIFAPLASKPWLLFAVALLAVSINAVLIIRVGPDFWNAQQVRFVFTLIQATPLWLILWTITATVLCHYIDVVWMWKAVFKFRFEHQIIKAQSIVELVILTIVIAPGISIYYVLLIGVIGAGLVVLLGSFLLIFVLASPVIAWRSVTISVLCFLTMMATNWMILKLGFVAYPTSRNYVAYYLRVSIRG